MAPWHIGVHVIRDVHAHFLGCRSKVKVTGSNLRQLDLYLHEIEKPFPDHSLTIVPAIVMKLYGKVHLTWVKCPIVFGGCKSKVKLSGVKT